MMEEKKVAVIANFNCTFGDEASPMLSHFDDIIWPALKKSSENDDETLLSKNNGKKTKYFLENIELVKNEKDDFVLRGILVKSTKLEVKSKYTDTGLVQSDEEYPSAPYSIFLISLINHRMILVKNQKGSPTVSNFAQTIEKSLKRYIKYENKKKDKENKLPTPTVNVVPIPYKNKVVEEIKNANKVMQVTFRVYPTNKDISLSPALETFRAALENAGSNTGNINMNSPKKLDSVADYVVESRGTAETTIKIEDKYGNRKKLTDKDFTEEFYIKIDDAQSPNYVGERISLYANNKTEFNEASESHIEEYTSKKTLLEKIFKLNKGDEK
ncbi:hypothetical protein AJL11_03205 [Listeria monocytogenes]|uniref:DUF4747 family protein n=1 Tax=Listeria monocytogenes TaxID=1639 RepID=A0A823IZS7_LISMN|nr:hypothetical protein [Listeria monocytogenes]EAG9354851.1 hypothetical protein [Listeria monocytogenes]OET20134.1 hypothetical protein AJL11_03205 [Listeria monocytogenes]OFG93501.1 hypothetical protein BJM83_06830 [Listeria monocytogenes]RFQ28275.1 hypothetical protein CRD70_14260 [Listeria monocytogenes]UIJ56089.1 hypothetical protein LZJ94_06210 [Listeria monocytogenes]